MARHALRAVQVVIAIAALFPLPASCADFPINYNLVRGSSVALDGKPDGSATVFIDTDKTAYLVCIPGDSNVYRIERKSKKVTAVKRSSVMVKAAKCRLVEGSREMPIQGHLYAETARGFSFNDLSGHKVAVTLPEGMKR